MPRLLATLKEAKAPRIVAVGDAISKLASDAGLFVDVVIIDRKEKRRAAAPFVPSKKRVFRLSNPAGTINESAWTTVRNAIEAGDALVEVEGEEDLLTLVAILCAPEGTVVLYGQPDQGVVVVRVDAEKRSEIERFVSAMTKT
jgi:hypothetical protein